MIDTLLLVSSSCDVLLHEQPSGGDIDRKHIRITLKYKILTSSLMARSSPLDILIKTRCGTVVFSASELLDPISTVQLYITVKGIVE